MITNKTVVNGPLIKKNVPHYIADELQYSAATKKDNITKLKGIGSQLTLLATVVDQIGEQIGLDSAEFTELQDLLAKIKSELE